MANRNATTTATIFVSFEAALAGLYDEYIDRRDVHGAIFGFGHDSRPEYLDDDNIDQVMSQYILSEWDWWDEARALQIYSEFRNVVLEAEKMGRVVWRQSDDQACWDSLGTLLRRQNLKPLLLPLTNYNHARSYGARQLAEAARDQGLEYRVFGYAQEVSP